MRRSWLSTDLGEGKRYAEADAIMDDDRVAYSIVRISSNRILRITVEWSIGCKSLQGDGRNLDGLSLLLTLVVDEEGRDKINN